MTLFTKAFAGGPFSIVPDGSLPTKVYQGDVAIAHYTITNLSSRQLPVQWKNTFS